MNVSSPVVAQAVGGTQVLPQSKGEQDPQCPFVSSRHLCKGAGSQSTLS